MEYFVIQRNVMNMQTNENRYVGFSGAARYIGVSIGTIRRMAESGKLRCYRVGDRLCRFDKVELDELVRGTAATSNERNSATV
jgi:excisionase family DNA binding protein